MADLPPRQQRFVDEYLIDLNATQAAIRAGYSAKTAGPASSRLLANVKISAEIAAKQQQKADDLGLSHEWVLERLRENVDRSMQAEEVLDSKGRGTGEYRYEGAVANRALELIGKHRGMFVEKMQIDIGRLNDLSDAELAAVVADARKAK